MGHNYERLKWVMVKKRVLNKCNKELAMCVCQRALKDISELVTHISLYQEVQDLSAISSANQGTSTSQSASKNRVDDRATLRVGRDRRSITGPLPP